MASRSRPSRRSDSDSDAMEILKPLVVLALFGTILYGAYSVVQKGPTSTSGAALTAGEAAPFAPPAVELAAAAPPAPVAPAAQIAPQPAAAPAPVSPATASPAPVMTAPVAPRAVAPAPVASAVVSPAHVPATEAASLAATFPPSAGTVGIVAPPTVPAAPPPAMPSEPPASPLPAAAAAAVAAGAGAAVGAAAMESRAAADGPTYLTAETAPPPAQDSLGSLPPPAATGERPERYATLAMPPPAAAPPSGGIAVAPSSATTGSSAAFATAWADAHEKLAAGRYAEALAALSIWYDDPSLGLEESQRLEDLLGQLAGTVIYSQQDLLMPPHVVAAGETLPTVALPLGISWQLLGKINGIGSPQELLPGEHLKVIRGPFDAVVSVSRRRLSLQLGGNYAGSFPAAVGRQFLARIGSAIPIADIRRGGARDGQAPVGLPTDPAVRPSIVLADGLVIEAADDPGTAGDSSPATSLVVSVRDLTELLDILGPGSKVLIRQ